MIRGNGYWAKRAAAFRNSLEDKCRTEEGVPLIQAAAVQPEFEFHALKRASSVSNGERCGVALDIFTDTYQ
jgi:hypothetical protein